MINLVKLQGGQKWHAHIRKDGRKETVCGYAIETDSRFVEVESAFDKPVNGSTCIKCQPTILEMLDKPS